MVVHVTSFREASVADPRTVTSAAWTPVRDLDVLTQAVRSCTACGLHRGRTNAVAGTGPAAARLVLVGVSPRRHEDLAGDALGGAARNVVDHALRHAGIDPGEVRFTNLVRCRTPQDRAPTRDEVRTCAPHLHAELDLVVPKVIVALGAFASSVLYGRPLSIERVAGYRLVAMQGITLIPTYHPAEVLRGESRAASALKRDLTTAKAVIDGLLPTGQELLAELHARGQSAY